MSKSKGLTGLAVMIILCLTGSVFMYLTGRK